MALSTHAHQVLNCRGKLHFLLKGQVEEAFDKVPGTLPGPLSVSKAHIRLWGHDNISEPCSPSENDLLTKCAEKTQQLHMSIEHP